MMNRHDQQVHDRMAIDGVPTPAAGAESEALASLLGDGGLVRRTVEARLEQLHGIRRHLHAHPELSHAERATTDTVVRHLEALGLRPVRMPRTGAYCDIPGSDPALAPIALRADMDALGIQELTDLPFRSTVDGVSHACGHDVHMTCVLGAAMALVAVADAGLLPRTVRLIFQPSEERHPCGALEMIGEGVADGLDSIYALHCDPSFDVGHVGLKPGPITSATDPVRIELSGSGGHTSRPHLTQDLIYAMGQIITQLPSALSRRMDPRSGVNLTWGIVSSGSAFNAIPSAGVLEGTLRCLDHAAWDRAEELMETIVADIAHAWGVTATVRHDRGVPPVENDPGSVRLLEDAAAAALGRASIDSARQSLGGEDFAWYLEKVPGALARLGTRVPGGRTYDLHMGDLEIDERAIGIGAMLLAGVCLRRDLVG